MKLLLPLLALPLHAAQVSFSWTANTETNLAGYNLYHGPTSHAYTNHVRLGLVTNYVMQVSGKQYFALSAFNAANQESALTAELVYDPPAPPADFRFSLLLISEESCDFVLWEPFATNTVAMSSPISIFRLRAERTP